MVRRGGFYTVYLWACLYYIFKFRKNYDVIVDSENGIPFFTPLFSTKPIILLIHHVHQEIFIEYMKFPFSHFARFIEGRVMPKVYKDRSIVTVSESTKKEIIKNKLGKNENIEIINPGITVHEVKIAKTTFPSFIYLGRLKPYKNIDVAIKAFSKISKKYLNAKFFIVGEGDSLHDLMELSRTLNLQGKVKFFKKVTENKKISLLSQSWIALQPSQVEGWGITVIEANACKTPVIASNANGLKDSIVDGKTGILVATKDIRALAEQMEDLLENKTKRKKLAHNSYIWAKNFSWKKNASNFYELLSSEYEKHKEKAFSFRPARLLNRFTSLF
jgi:glycosyltransferase involved in cell wall biosynthesis